MLIDQRLVEGSVHLGDLALCRVFLVDNALFPWLVLVPLQDGKLELIDLHKVDQYKLIDEIDHVSRCFKELFSPDKINVAALGNQVSQLHIHVIARFKDDKAWPKPIWGEGGENYAKDKLERLALKLKEKIF